MTDQDILRHRYALLLIMVGPVFVWGWRLYQALVQNAPKAAAAFAFVLGAGLTAGAILLAGGNSTGDDC
jgi:hypothetical protein